jgi:hypothetical protein
MKGKAILAATLVIALSLGLYLTALGVLPALYGAAVGRIVQSSGDFIVTTPPFIDETIPPVVILPPIQSTTPDGFFAEPIIYHITFPDQPWEIRTPDAEDERESCVSYPTYENWFLRDYENTVHPSYDEAIDDGMTDHKCRNVHYVITPPAESGMDPYEVCLDGFLITADGIARRIPDFSADIYEIAHKERYIKIPYERETAALDPAIAALTETYFLYRDDRPNDMTSVACLGRAEGVGNYWCQQKTDYQSLSEEQFTALLNDSAELMTFAVLNMPEINVQIAGPNVSITISVPANFILPQSGVVYGDALRQLLAYRLLLVSHPDAYLWGSEYENLFYVTDLSEDTDMTAIRRWIKDGDISDMIRDTVVFEVTETGVLRYDYHHEAREYTVTAIYDTAITLPLSISGGLS